MGVATTPMVWVLQTRTKKVGLLGGPFRSTVISKSCFHLKGARGGPRSIFTFLFLIEKNGSYQELFEGYMS